MGDAKLTPRKGRRAERRTTTSGNQTEHRRTRTQVEVWSQVKPRVNAAVLRPAAALAEPAAPAMCFLFFCVRAGGWDWKEAQSCAKRPSVRGRNWWFGGRLRGVAYFAASLYSWWLGLVVWRLGGSHLSFYKTAECLPSPIHADPC